MKTLLWAISKINSGAATLHSCCLPTLMSCIFPFPWPTHFLGSQTFLGTGYMHRHTGARWTALSHSLGCLGVSQPQPGKQIVPLAQYRSLAVSLASPFVLCPTEYAKGFLPQQKNKLWWVLTCLCKHVFMTAAFKSQLLTSVCIICSWSWSSLKAQLCSDSEANIFPKTIIFSRKVTIFLIWFCLLDGKQGGVIFLSCQASQDRGGLGLNYFS